MIDLVYSSARDKRSPLLKSIQRRSSTEDFIRYSTVPSDVNEFTFENLDHYSSYMIFVAACLNETSNPTCSSESTIHAETLRSESADEIQAWAVVVMPSNKTAHDVAITWTPPTNPNGAILNYVVKQKRMNDEKFGEKVTCVSLLNQENLSSHTIEKMKPGNYSLQIAAVTLGGQGNYSTPKYVYIKSPSHFSLIASPAFLSLIFLIVASIIATFVYILYKRNQSPENVTQFESFQPEHDPIIH